MLLSSVCSYNFLITYNCLPPWWSSYFIRWSSLRSWYHFFQWSLLLEALQFNFYKSLLSTWVNSLNLSSSSIVQVKKMLYLALVRSKITHCSQLWKPHHIKDIKALEKIQRRVTMFILNDFSTKYRSRLISLGLLRLMYIFELLTSSFSWNAWNILTQVLQS